MEHRWGIRWSLGEEIKVCKEGDVLGRARAVDMNVNGMGLECDLDLHTGQIVELDLPGGGCQVRCLVLLQGNKSEFTQEAIVVV